MVGFLGGKGTLPVHMGMSLIIVWML